MFVRKVNTFVVAILRNQRAYELVCNVKPAWGLFLCVYGIITIPTGSKKLKYFFISATYVSSISVMIGDI